MVAASTRVPDVSTDTWTNSSVPPSTVNISMEKVGLNKSIIEQTLLIYVTPFDKINPTLTEAEEIIWRERFFKKAWWITWSRGVEGGVSDL